MTDHMQILTQIICAKLSTGIDPSDLMCDANYYSHMAQAIITQSKNDAPAQLDRGRDHP